MRLGVSTSFTHSSPEDWLEKNINLKLKSVVFPVSFDADESLIQQYAKLAVENDITIAEVGIWRNTLSADSDERKKMTEYAINPEMPVIIEHLNSDEAYVESVKYVQNLCAGKGI